MSGAAVFVNIYTVRLVVNNTDIRTKFKESNGATWYDAPFAQSIATLSPLNLP